QLAAPRLAERRSRNEAELRDLLACRRQLTVTRTQQSNRRGATASRAALKALDRQIASLDEQVRALVDADDDFRDLARRLRSVPGVGPTLAATLLADLRELGGADRRRVCALAGVAPF